VEELLEQTSQQLLALVRERQKTIRPIHTKLEVLNRLLGVMAHEHEQSETYWRERQRRRRDSGTAAGGNAGA